MRRSEDARIEYERNNQIWAVDDKNNVTTQRLADLNKELTDAQSDSLKKQALYEFAKAGDLEAVPQLRDNSVLQGMQTKRADLSVQYTDAVNQYGPNFPRVQRLQAQMKALDEQMMRERKGIIVQLESDYREAKQHEDLLSKALDEQKAEVNAMSEKMIQYNILKREAEANKALYDGLETKLKEAADLFRAEVLQYSNCRSSDDSIDTLAASQDPEYCPGVSRRPGRRHWPRTSPRVSGQHREDPGRCGDADAPAFACGCACSSRIAQLRRRKPDFPRPLRPMATRSELNWLRSTCPNRRCRKPSAPCEPHCCSRRPDHPPQVILVTSALPREGKTTAAANLAVTLAQLGDKTVLVDADLRKPGVGRLLNLGTGKYAGLELVSCRRVDA